MADNAQDGNLLAVALAELSESRQEAQEDGFPEPTELAVGAAGEMLRRLVLETVIEPAVYPTEDREIAITFGALDASVMLLCRADGGVACYSSIRGDLSSAVYSSADRLPDAFVREQLRRAASPSS